MADNFDIDYLIDEMNRLTRDLKSNNDDNTKNTINELKNSFRKNRDELKNIDNNIKSVGRILDSIESIQENMLNKMATDDIIDELRKSLTTSISEVTEATKNNSNRETGTQNQGQDRNTGTFIDDITSKLEDTEFNFTGEPLNDFKEAFINESQAHYELSNNIFESVKSIQETLLGINDGISSSLQNQNYNDEDDRNINDDMDSDDITNEEKQNRIEHNKALEAANNLREQLNSTTKNSIETFSTYNEEFKQSIGSVSEALGSQDDGLGGIMNHVGNVFKGSVGIVNGIFNTLGAVPKLIGDTISSVGSSIKNLPIPYLSTALGGFIDLIGKATSKIGSMIQSITGLNNVLSGVIGALTGYGIVEAVDNTVTQYNRLARTGIDFEGSMMNLREEAARAGMSLQEFGNIVENNTAAVKFFGQESSSTFGELAANVRESGEQLYKMGLRTDEINSFLATYLETERMALQERELRSQRERMLFLDMQESVRALSQATGKAAEDIMDRFEESATLPELQTLLADETEEVRQSLTRFHAAVGEAGPGMQDILTSVIGDLQGFTSEQIAAFERNAPDVLDEMRGAVEAIRSGEISAEEGLQRMSEAAEQIPEEQFEQMGFEMQAGVEGVQGVAESLRNLRAIIDGDGDGGREPLTSAFQTLSQNMTNFKSNIQTFLNLKWEEEFVPIFEEVLNAFSNLTEGTMFEDIGRLFEENLSQEEMEENLGRLNEFINTVTDYIENYFSSLATIFGQVDLSEEGQNLGDITDALRNPDENTDLNEEQLGEVQEHGYLAGFIDFLRWIGDFSWTAFQGGVDAFTGIIGPLFNWAKDTIDQINWEEVGNNINDFIEAFSEVNWDDVIDDVTKIADAISSLADILSWFTSDSDAAQQASTTTTSSSGRGGMESGLNTQDITEYQTGDVTRSEVRQNIEQQNPNISADEIDERMSTFLQEAQENAIEKIQLGHSDLSDFGEQMQETLTELANRDWESVNENTDDITQPQFETFQEEVKQALRSPLDSNLENMIDNKTEEIMRGITVEGRGGMDQTSRNEVNEEARADVFDEIIGHLESSSQTLSDLSEEQRGFIHEQLGENVQADLKNVNIENITDNQQVQESLNEIRQENQALRETLSNMTSNEQEMIDLLREIKEKDEQALREDENANEQVVSRLMDLRNEMQSLRSRMTQ